MQRMNRKVVLVTVVLIFLAGLLMAQAKTAMVNINSADEATLTTLHNIGKSKAQAIIQYRQDKGDFKTIDQLKEVSGIGDRIFESIKDKITVGAQ